MRTFRSRLWTGALPAMLAFAGLGMLAMAEGRAGFTAHEKAFYADPSVVLYVQPGLNINVVAAKIAANGTISVDYKLTDPTGAALDQTGVTTPGPVTLSFLAAYIPSGQAQYTSYITRVATAATGGATATQATADSGGTTQTVSTGEYIYTFTTVAPSGFNANATHRIGIYGSRNLTQWDLGTNYADTDLRFRAVGQRNCPRRATSCAPPIATPATGARDQPPAPTAWPRTADRAQTWTCASCATSRRPPIPIPATAWT